MEGNEFKPKKPEYKDTLITLYHNETKKNVLVSQKYALENKDEFGPEVKADTTKAAVDTTTNKLVFVTNQQIVEGEGRYQPAILGQNLTVGANGEISLKSELVGTGEDDATVKQKDSYYILEDLNIRTTELKQKLIDTPESYFGFEGAVINFYNKYITQLGLPFNEAAAEIRSDINILSQTARS